VPGDTIFSIGALALTIFVIGLWLFPRRESDRLEAVERERERQEGARLADTAAAAARPGER
jgi:hypothetical protein